MGQRRGVAGRQRLVLGGGSHDGLPAAAALRRSLHVPEHRRVDAVAGRHQTWCVIYCYL